MVKKIMSMAIVVCLAISTITGCKGGSEKSSTILKTTPKSNSTATPLAKTNSPAVSAASASSTANSNASPVATNSGKITDYSVEVDFKVISSVAGVVFGFKDETQFLMWQVSVREASQEVYLAPHSFDTTFTVIDQINISDFVKWEDAYKIHHLKITVDSKNEIKTYIDNNLIYTYQDEIASYGEFGFRQCGGGEEAIFDNFVVKNSLTNQILKQVDFNSETNPLPEGELIKGEMGDSQALKISSCSGVGQTCILP